MTDAAAARDLRVPPAVESLGMERRMELAAFLRSRRGRISPEQMGLAPGLRRRTPGLRREEVAQLSGIGVTWYTWLEQGRPIKVSEQVLDAVARTLQLDSAERSHLFTLADMPLPPKPTEPLQSLQCVQRMLTKLHPYPAQLLNERYDVLAWNDAASEILCDWSQYDEDDRNLLWWVYGKGPRHCRMLRRDEEMPRVIAMFRAAYGKHIGEPAWEELVQRLSAASSEFAALWEEHQVAEPSTRQKQFLHPELGLLSFKMTSYRPVELLDARMSVYVPADDETEEKIQAWT